MEIVEYYNPKLDRTEKVEFSNNEVKWLFENMIRKHKYFVLE